MNRNSIYIINERIIGNEFRTTFHIPDRIVWGVPTGGTPTGVTPGTYPTGADPTIPAGAVSISCGSAAIHRKAFINNIFKTNERD